MTSQPTPTACTPWRSATSSAASLALASSRSRMATFQPAAARACAVARPMPRLEPAPVTMAVLSETDMVVLPVGYSPCARGEIVLRRRRSDGGRGGVGGPRPAVAAESAAELGLDPGRRSRRWTGRSGRAGWAGRRRRGTRRAARSARRGCPTPAKARVAATDSASPPTTVWFSAVTTSRSVRATRRIASRSSGLIVGTCSTATSTWSASSRAAACSARMVISPVEMITTSRPVRSSAALPSSNR